MTSIGDPFSVAAQSLGAIQRQVGTIAQNVAHAYDPAYSRRDISISDNGNGVNLSPTITRASDIGLRNQILDATAQVAGADAKNTLFQNLAQISGTAQSTSILQDRLGALTNAAQTFQADPNSAASESALISAADQFASDVRKQFSALRAGEANAVNDASQSVSDLNTQLKQIESLNKQAQSEFANGGVAPATADRRDGVLRDIAKAVPVSVTENPDGSIGLATKGGTSLVNGIAAQFSFDGASRNIIPSGATPPAGFGAPGSLNQSFTGGRLGALVGALDPTTTNPDPAVGLFAKNRAQLSGLVDNFANTSSNTNPSAGALVNLYAAAPSSRPNDLAGGPLPAQGLFVTTSAPGFVDEGSFAINPALANGTATIKQGAAASLVSFLTTPAQSIGGPGAPIGGLSLANQTPGQLAGGITGFWTQAQSAISGNAAQASQSQAALANHYSARNGVDVDRELVDLSQAQNLYKASAKILDAQDKLFNTLLNIVK